MLFNFLPVVREFELDNPRMKKIVDREFQGINTRYLKSFVQAFSQNESGQVSFLTPFSGIGFPGKPVLHPQLYRSISLVQSRSTMQIPIYLVGAYPDWNAYRNYFAPLLSRHDIVARGPFSLSIGNYDAARSVLETELNQLRQSARFTPPDYDRILTK